MTLIKDSRCLRYTGIFCLLFFTLAFSGCGLFKPPVVNIPPPPPPPKPTIVKGMIDVDKGVNADPKGKPSPLVLRVYELKTLDAFNKADFDTLYQNDATTLAGDIQLRDEKIVRPGDQITIAAREAQKDTHFIAVFAAYRDLDHSTWRAALPVTPHVVTAFVVNVAPLAVTIKEGAP